MTAWHSNDVDGRKARAARKASHGARAKMADRRAWLLKNHAAVTQDDAAAEWNVSPHTIWTDECALGVKCKAREKAPRTMKYRAEPAGESNVVPHVRWVAERLRAWR